MGLLRDRVSVLNDEVHYKNKEIERLRNGKILFIQKQFNS